MFLKFLYYTRVSHLWPTLYFYWMALFKRWTENHPNKHVGKDNGLHLRGYELMLYITTTFTSVHLFTQQRYARNCLSPRAVPGFRTQRWKRHKPFKKLIVQARRQMSKLRIAIRIYKCSELGQHKGGIPGQRGDGRQSRLLRRAALSRMSNILLQIHPYLALPHPHLSPILISPLIALAMFWLDPLFSGGQKCL